MWRRLEVPSMSLELNDNNSSSVKNLVDFQGKILLCDTFHIHEIYNSKTLGSLYTDLSTNKREMRDPDLPVNKKKMRFPHWSYYEDSDEDSEDYGASEIKDDHLNQAEETIFGDNHILLGGDHLTMNEKEIQESGCPPMISLPVMGPGRGMLTMPYFHVIVHEDSGDPKIEDDLLNQAEETIFGDAHTLSGDVIKVCDVSNMGYDKRFYMYVDLKFGVLILDCIVYSPPTKVVNLEVEWLKPNKKFTDDSTGCATDYSYLHGSIILTSSIFDDVVSVLLDTPPKKALKVKAGEPIPLLKSVAVIPFCSSFTVNAELQYSDRTFSALYPIVEEGEVTFPVEDDDEDVDKDFEPSDYTYCQKYWQCVPFYKSTKYIDCIDGGQLKVKAFVMCDH